MNIAFDALPLMGRLTGIGYCEAGQIKALARSHPEHRFALQYFAVRKMAEKQAALAPFLSGNMYAKRAFFPPFVYRALSAFLPLPYRWFFGKKACLTHFFNYIVPPFVAGKTVVTVHDMVLHAYPETVRGRTRLMLQTGLRKSMKRADRIVTDSYFSRAEIIRYYPEFADKIRVVPCGVDTNRFHPETDAKKIAQVREKHGLSASYFLYLGTLEPRKNLERLIDAYAQFAASHTNPAQLVLAGGKGWLYDGIFAKVQSLGLEDRVIFTQYIAEEELCALMSGALAFTFPSLYEGFGMPPLEAMACGTPVLVSDAASLPEVTGDSAVIVKADSTEDIAAGLHRLFTDAALRKRLSAEGLDRAKTFSWERSAAMLYDVYCELIPALKEQHHG
ncbi:MAG: glycosyltransferase family 4 protein [Oscillospiraceae bacterium]|nr:glycosyltransferase family 4 protein [Oscillospiraceae bacterium]